MDFESFLFSRSSLEICFQSISLKIFLFGSKQSDIKSVKEISELTENKFKVLKIK